nr:4184_t:CDS:2 [Entrophospora candida]
MLISRIWRHSKETISHVRPATPETESENKEFALQTITNPPQNLSINISTPYKEVF